MNTEFNSHWEKAKYETPSQQKLKVAKSFLEPVFHFIEISERPVRILDAGCGDGVHALVLSSNILKKFSCIGVDISSVAVDICRRRLTNDSRFTFEVCDIENDCPEGPFDIVLSYGVLAYTRQPALTVANLTNNLRQGGIFVSWVYEPAFLPRYSLIFLRKFAKLIGASGTDKLASVIVQFMNILPISSGVNLSNSTFQQCKETVLVNIAPEQLWLPTESEVASWFAAAGLMLTHATSDVQVWSR